MHASIYPLLILNGIYYQIQVFSNRNSTTSCSYALFDMDGKQVPPELVTKVGEIFETILQEASNLFINFPMPNKLYIHS